MFKLIIVTNRHLCREDFLTRLDRLAALRPAAVLLREKDLSPQAYLQLAQQVLHICRRYETPCILHGFVQAAQLSATALHLPLPVLRSLTAGFLPNTLCLGASCHSVQEVCEATTLGCSYLIVGHIFDTSCKPGIPARGTALLRTAVQSTAVPVYAIGGISPERVAQIRATGAAGACVMHAPMQCADPAAYWHSLSRAAGFDGHAAHFK